MALLPTFDSTSRAHAAGWHLLISAGVAAAAALLVFGIWFPPPYPQVSGGADLFLLLVGVDVALGPLITFAVFDRRKLRTELARDLGVVALLQLGGLGYGLHAVSLARPVVLAFEGERFRAVPAAAVVESELSQAPPSLRRLSLTGPVVVSTRMPTDPDERFEAIAMAMGGADLGMRPRYWLPWNDESRRRALTAAAPLGPLLRARPALAEAVAATGHQASSLRQVPLLARADDWVVLLDAAEGHIVGFAPLAPEEKK
jgi:hypothetical protein